MKKRLYYILTLLIIAAAVIIAQSWQNIVPQIHARAPQHVLTMRAFDVGQGDATLVITPSGKTILIDGGPDDTVMDKLGRALPFFKKDIDLMILTHPHSDHVTGLVSVLKRYKVKEIYYTGTVHTSSVFIEWLKLIKEKQIPMHIVSYQEELQFDEGVKLAFLYPDHELAEVEEASEEKRGQRKNNLNNTSIVFKIAYGRTQFLFMGDAEAPVEETLLASGADLRADVLKAGHHGSHSSTSEDFLKAVSPRYATISAGRNNDYGHPHLSTLKRLERFGVYAYRTDTEGDITIMSDGEKIIDAVH
ncbi:MAG: MBL fold metallo-hydrolase [Candidatus Magasanikbacteria bacterium]|nr:MBL fold metallo-hydrolase [Candidatus Magasanikbacteria bacterium]